MTHLLSIPWKRLRAVMFRARLDRELDEELRYHLDREIDAGIARGLNPTEARYAALHELGAITQNKEACRDMRRVNIIENLAQDLRFGLRTMRRRPLVSIVAIVVLGLGIGANTAVFTLLYGLLYRPLPVRQPDQLVRINLIGPQVGPRRPSIGISWPILEQIKQQQRSFSAISAWTFRGVMITDNDGTLRQYLATLVSGNAFDVLGLQAYRGRLLQPQDDVRGGPPQGWVAVISYGFWAERFAFDPGVLGKTLRLGNNVVTIVGVAPPPFQGILPGSDSKVYLPLQFSAALAGRDDINVLPPGACCVPIARLNPQTSIQQAAAEFALFVPLVNSSLPPQARQAFKDARLDVQSARTGLPASGQSYAGSLWLMQALVAAVLLLCCLNVGGLMFSNIDARRYEFAVRTAMGAQAARIFEQLLVESLLIASAGAVLGAAGAWYGTRLLLAFFISPNAQSAPDVRPDQTTFVVAGILTLVATLLFGCFPAWKASRAHPGSLLRSRSSLGLGKQIVARALVPVQVGFSFTLVVLAALLSQSLIRMRTEHTGFNTHVTITTPQFQALPQKGIALLDVYQQMVDKLESSPGMQSAAVTWYTPMTNSQAASSFEALTGGPNPPSDARMAFNDVGPGYFRTMQTAIVTGREFERQERDRTVCILNQAAASHLFPGQNAMGQHVRATEVGRPPGGATCRVVGIAEDAKYASTREQAPRTIYFPLSAETVRGGNLVFLMRSVSKAEAISAYRAALAIVAPTTALLRFATLEEQIDASIGAQRLITLLSNFFGGLALLLSAAGLYGLLASNVTRRTPEIGVRLALGAKRSTVVGLVMRQALGTLLIGVVLGIGALFFTLRFVVSMLYGVSPWDFATLISVAGLLVLIGVIAALVPARRAASVDPIQALRAE